MSLKRFLARHGLSVLFTIGFSCSKVRKATRAFVAV
jgi:hypothetical protein